MTPGRVKRGKLTNRCANRGFVHRSGEIDHRESRRRDTSLHPRRGAGRRGRLELCAGLAVTGTTGTADRGMRPSYACFRRRGECIGGRGRDRAPCRSGADRIRVMAGGGVREENVREVIARTRVAELHTGVGRMAGAGQWPGDSGIRLDRRSPGDEGAWWEVNDEEMRSLVVRRDQARDDWAAPFELTVGCRSRIVDPDWRRPAVIDLREVACAGAPSTRRSRHWRD